MRPGSQVKTAINLPHFVGTCPLHHGFPGPERATSFREVNMDNQRSHYASIPQVLWHLLKEEATAWQMRSDNILIFYRVPCSGREYYGQKIVIKQEIGWKINEPWIATDKRDFKRGIPLVITDEEIFKNDKGDN